MTTPFFSVLIPTYNQAKYVGAALDSLLVQTDPDWEAVVVNDGSTDETPKVLEQYARRDRRIRVFHKTNGGTGSALNAALNMARGQWICWLSSDDLFDATKLELHRQWIGNKPTCQFFFTYWRMLCDLTGKTINHGLCGPLPPQEFQVLGLFYRNYVGGISICVNRKEWECVGRFNEKLRYAQDYDMWLRLLSRCPATFIPEWTCSSRVHARQGSALFERACYYDSATAAIKFLNENRFEDLFPLLDLRDTATALRALEQALFRASDESSFLYWFGAHPALLLRTLAWAWDKSLGQAEFRNRAPLREAARQIVGDTARKLRGTPLGWHWHAAKAATELDQVDFNYSPIDPVDVGRGFVKDLRVRNSTELDEVVRYFKMQYALELPVAPEHLGRRTVVVCQRRSASSTSSTNEGFSADVAEWAQMLEQSGCNVAVLSHGPDRFCQVRNVPLIEASGLKNLNEVMSALLPTDAVIWLDEPPASITAFPARHHHVLTEEGVKKSSVVRQIVAGVADMQRPQRSVASRQPVHRKKVVFIGYGCTPAIGGGAPRVIFDLLNRIDTQRFDLHFVDLKASSEPALEFDSDIRIHHLLQEEIVDAARPPLWERAIRRGLRVTRRGLDAARGVLRSLFTQESPKIARPDCEVLFDSIRHQWPYVVGLREIFRRIGGDALLVPVLEENLVRVWLAQAYSRQRICASLHIAESIYLPTIYPDRDRLTMERFLFTGACRDAAIVAVPSLGCKEDLIENLAVPAASIEVAPNPIDMRRVVQATLDAPEIPLPNFQDKCLFVHAARLCPQKNHRLLLEACRILKQTHPNFLVVCLGDGGWRRSIQNEIEEMDLTNHVLLLGAVKNPFAYMARAQGVLLTSSFEAFALVLVEALACGAVPVSVDCPFGPSEVLEDGKYGVLVPNNDPKAFANAMCRVMVDGHLRDVTRKQGPVHAYKYDVSNVVPQWEERFERIMTSPLPAAKSAVADGDYATKRVA